MRTARRWDLLPGIAPGCLAFQRSQLPSHCSRHRLPLLTANGGCGYQRSLHSSATRPSRQAEQLGMGDCCVPCRIGLPSERHRYRLAIGVKEKAKKPSADGDGCGADEQKCAIYQRKRSAGEHRNHLRGRQSQIDKHPSMTLTKSKRNRTAKSTMTLRNRQ